MSYRLRNLASLNQDCTSRSLVSPSSRMAKLRITSMPVTSKISWNKTRYSMISNSLLDQGLLKYCSSQTCQLSGSTFGIIRAEAKLSASSISALTLADISLLLEGQTWTQAYPNAKTAGGGNMQSSLAKSKAPSMSSAMVHTNLRTTENLGGAAKQMKRQTLCALRLRRAIHALTRSNALIVEAITKLTPTSAHSGGIDSTENDTKRNTTRSVKIGSNWLALWRATSSKYNFEKPQYPFTKCLQEPPHSQYYSWDSVTLWHYSHPRTALVCHLPSSKHCE